MSDRWSKKRRAILRATAGRWHRYRRFRGVTMVVTLVVLLMVPLVGIARFDLFGTEHRALLEEADPLSGLIAVSVAIFAFYFFTFQINLVAGRMFCGWGCPVGQLNRLADTAGAQTKAKPRLLWNGMLVLFATALSLSISLWWATGLYALLLTVPLAAVTIAFARKIGWSFCKKLCPVGLYYSVVQTKRPLGILFDRSACLDEAACVRACPVDLDPRDLGALKQGIGGLAVDGLTENSHCLRCGACVEACELVTTKLQRPALTFGRPEEERTPTGDLVQIGRSNTPLPMLVRSEPSQDLPPIRERIFHREIAGTGLSPFAMFFVLLAGSAAFLFFGGALWTVAPGTPLGARFPVGLATAALLAALVLAGKRASLGQWLSGVGAALLMAGFVVTGLYAAFSPGAVNRYTPRETWAAKAKPKQTAPKGYAQATGAYDSATIHGRANAGAVVYLDAPPPGRALDARRTIEVKAPLQGAVVIAHPRDKLKLMQTEQQLHTIQISAEGRIVRSIPLVAGHAERKVRLPPPGNYEIDCANHEGEKAALIVLDHPYVARVSEEGTFVLEDVPARTVTVVIRDGSEKKTKSLQLSRGEVRELRL